MQTFLPFADFTKCAEVLDDKRLGNQCYRECLTLYNGRWPNHPACKMWVGYENSLAQYALALAIEMRKRKRDDGSPKWRPIVSEKWIKFWSDEATGFKGLSQRPPWLGDERIHSSHRAALLAKDYEFYSKFGWSEAPSLDYWWPTPM